MTPAEIDQLIGEKIAAAITAYATTRNDGEGSKSVGEQEIMAKDIEEKAEGKRKRNEIHGKNFVQYPNEKQEMVKTYNERQNVKKKYLRNHPYCGRCDRHHPGPCTIVCNRCQKIGYEARNCRSPVPIAKAAAPRGCYKCGVMGHIKRSCPKLKRQTLRAYEIVIKEDHQDLN